MSIFGAALLLLFAILIWLLWRAVRCLEWLVMYLQGFSDKFASKSQELAEQDDRYDLMQAKLDAVRKKL